MKIIKEGNPPVRDVLSRTYVCPYCSCQFQLEEKDLERPGAGEEYGHVSDPMRYQTCPTCDRDVAIWNRKNWFTMRPLHPDRSEFRRNPHGKGNIPNGPGISYNEINSIRYPIENAGMSLSRAMAEERSVKPDESQCLICGKISNAMTWNHEKKGWICDFGHEEPVKPVSDELGHSMPGV